MLVFVDPDRGPTPPPPPERHLAQEYWELEGQLSGLIWEAKEYIEAYAARVTDWSDLTLDNIRNGGHQSTNPNELKKGKYLSAKSLADAQWWADLGGAGRQADPGLGPVETITDIVFDRSDGDFSLTINGRQWWWIDYQSVFEIAHYIHRQLNPPADEPRERKPRPRKSK
jgi:hypothetical protein